MDPELIHQWTVTSLKWIQSDPHLLQFFSRKDQMIDDPRLHSEYMGLLFKNPIGLAAGFDKHANIYPALSSLGFGFIEVGTLTPRPQSGNPKPRLFRLSEDEAIINRMGFNNCGILEAKKNFKRLSRPSIPIGVNLGKNKDTPNEHAREDYLLGMQTLYSYADYFVINVSSPNTQGLRDLQKTDLLYLLLSSLVSERNELIKRGPYRPLFVKLSPDLPSDQIKELVQMIMTLPIDGIIATNTTLSRDGLHSPLQHEMGGLSGKPLDHRSTMFIRSIFKITNNKIPIIGVGGIFTGHDAYRKMRAGANLIQVYTGMIYRGPSIVRFINQELLNLLERDGISNIKDIVGLDV